MATIDFTANFNAPTGLNSTFIAPTTSRPAANFSTTYATSPLMPAFTGAVNQGMMYFHIMKGAVPTDAEVMTSFSARSADVLITWQRGSGAGMINGAINNFTPSTESTNPLVLNTTLQAASASGVATWFWWTTRAASSTTGAATDVVYHSIIGTVGVSGSGSDLETATTTIGVGKLYKLSNFRIQLPQSLTIT